MFYTLQSVKQGKAFGSSAFIEIQYCKLKPNTPVQKVVSIPSIDYWQEDSLYVYVDDMDKFYSNYKGIFTDGIYGNLKKGEMDVYGINYYSSQQLTKIIDKIEKQQPCDYAVLLEWLKQGIKYNGFYILGI